MNFLVSSIVMLSVDVTLTIFDYMYTDTGIDTDADIACTLADIDADGYIVYVIADTDTDGDIVSTLTYIDTDGDIVYIHVDIDTAGDIVGEYNIYGYIFQSRTHRRELYFTSAPREKWMAFHSQQWLQHHINVSTTPHFIHCGTTTTHCSSQLSLQRIIFLSLEQQHLLYTYNYITIFIYLESPSLKRVPGIDQLCS